MLSQSKRKIALFAALCLFCSILELSIPKPVFIRLGFSNGPLLVALYSGFSFVEFCSLVLLKIFLQGFINGTLFSYAFILSMAGSVSSSLVMFFFYKLLVFLSKKSKRRKNNQYAPVIASSRGEEKPDSGEADKKKTMWAGMCEEKFSFSFITISEAGAFVSNIVQIFVSRFFLGEGVYTLAPVILGCGIVSSFVLGLLTQLFCKKSQFLDTITEPSFFAAYLAKPVKYMTRGVKTGRIIKMILGGACLTLCLFTDSVTLCGVMSLCLLLFCVFTKRKVRFVPVAWTIVRTVAISMFVPAGRILFAIGDLKITQDSIFLGLHRSFVILSSTFFSRFLVPKPNEEESPFKPNSIYYMSLDYFKEVSEEWYKQKEKNLARRIDKTLLIAIKKCSNVW